MESGPNVRLASVMGEAGVSNKALARAVRELSSDRGRPLGCDHTAVGHWLTGTQPREATARLVVDVLSARLSRSVTAADVGFRIVDQPDERLGLGYADCVDQAATVLGQLWQADQEELRAVVSAPTAASAWSEASLSWLVRTGPDELSVRAAGTRVGISDVDRLQATVSVFSELDDRFGGGHARRSLVEYLRSDVAALLTGRYGQQTGRALHRAAAEGTLLAAWMTYDAGIHGLAQRYFIQALRLAQASDDALLAGSILDAMSHQATFLGRHREAANLARAARQGTTGRATSTLTAHFHAMEARALAVAGDRAGSERALSEAVRVFEKRQPGADPDWIAYFDDAELSAEFAHCFRDLGRPRDAVTYALRSANTSARSDFFVSMVLAAGHLGGGDVDEACAAVRRALDAGAALKSAPCAEHVGAFRRQLIGYERLSVVRDLSSYAELNHLWQASTIAA